MNLGDRSDLQLLRVSKGAHELKKMIDYWSKSSNHKNGQQNYIFDDLLRGAMEFQESLLMLSNLQKATGRISTKRIRQNEREEVAEENAIDFVRQKRLHERTLSADRSSTNYTQEMKQVIRDKFNKFDYEKVSSTKNSILSKSEVEFSAQGKKMKAPNLIARLMGLEDFPLIEAGKEEKVLKRSRSHAAKKKSLDEIIENMRSTGFLKSEQSVSFMTKSDMKKEALFTEKDDIPPIVIIRPVNLLCGNTEGENLTSETSDLTFEERVSDADCEFYENLERSEVMSIEEEIEPPQKHKIAAASAQKQLKRDLVLKERKVMDDLEKIESNGKKQMKKKKLKAVRETMNMNPKEAETLQATTSFTSKTNKSSEQNMKHKFLMKSASSDSISHVKSEKISAGKPIRKSIKPEDKKSEGKFNGTLTESREISRSKSMLAADSLLKQVLKEPAKPFKKDETRKNHKVICEVMPRNYKDGKGLEMFEESIRKSYYKPLTIDIKHAFYQTTFLEEDEVFYDQLLRNSTKGQMVQKNYENDLSTHQMIRERVANEASCTSFKCLLEEDNNGINKLRSYSEFDDACYEDCIDCMLKKDLYCKETMLNVISDSWICVEEADMVVSEVSERIFFRLLLEVANDLS